MKGVVRLGKKLTFNSKEEIIDYIENYGDREKGFDEYHFIWVANILRATIDNMMKHSLPIEVEEFGDYVNDEEKNFFINLAKCLEHYKDD